MKLGSIAASALVLVATLSGCGGSKANDTPPGPVSFAAEPESDGAVVFLRGRTEGDRVFADVVARGITDVHGAAFRVTWDPDALSFVEAQRSPAWSPKAVLLAKEGAPGTLAVAWTEKGEAMGHDASTPLVLGTLVFDAKSRKGTRIAFRTDRSTVVNHEGKTQAVAWRAGKIPAR